jgi:hypothetical protein
MLYISRKISNEKYGVVDTDDNVEEIVTFNELSHYVIDLGVEINGVRVSQTRGLTPKKFISTVVPYAYTTDAKAVKLKVIKGVEISAHNGVIGKIIINRDAQSKSPINLSDYGTKVENYAFSITGKPLEPITFIFDNNLNINSIAFSSINGYPDIANYIHCDVRGITNEKVAKAVYMGCMHKTSWVSSYEPESFGISDDNIARKDYYKAMTIIGKFDYELYKQNAKPVSFINKDDTCKKVEKSLRTEFNALGNVEFSEKYLNTKKNGEYVSMADLVRNYSAAEVFNNRTLMKPEYMMGLINAALIITFQEATKLRKLQAFLMLFGPYESAGEAYKSYIKRLYRFAEGVFNKYER